MHYSLDGFICELRNILGDLWTLDMSGVFDPDLEKIGRAGPTSSKGFRNISRNFHAWINREKKNLTCGSVNSETQSTWASTQDERGGQELPNDWFEGMGRVLTSRGTWICTWRELARHWLPKNLLHILGNLFKAWWGTPCLCRLSQVILGEPCAILFARWRRQR